MLFRTLGALAVEDDAGRPIVITSPRCRTLLAALLLHRGRSVSTDELVVALWPTGSPRTAEKTLQTYVSQLRRLLGADRIETRGRGYQIRIVDGECDADRLEKAVATGEGLAEALSLWRGRPFQELSDGHVEGARLEELMLTGLEDQFGARLAARDHRALVPELEAAVARYPLREALWAQLMLALHGSNRQGDAVRAFTRIRSVLNEELGVDPGPALQHAHQTVLGPPSDAPRTHYIERAGWHVAYQMAGTSGPDILVIPDWFNNINLLWTHSAPRDLLKRLGTNKRLLLFDPIGMGASDPLPASELPTLDGWLRDAVSVLDVTESERTTVIASSAGAAIAIMLAARFPERVEALVLHNTAARITDTLIGLIGYEQVVRLFAEKWATGVAIPNVAPSRVNDHEFNTWFGSFMAGSATAGYVRSLIKMVFSMDVSSLVHHVEVPTLVTCRRENRIVSREVAQALAEQLPQGNFVELPGADHVWFLDDGTFTDAVDDFLERQKMI